MTNPTSEQVELALDELDGSDFEAIREHSATLRAALASVPATDKAGDDALVGELEALHNDARGCEFDLVPADGPIARLALFMHERGDTILTRLRHPTLSATDAPSDELREAAIHAIQNAVVVPTSWSKEKQAGARHAAGQALDAIRALSNTGEVDNG